MNNKIFKSQCVSCLKTVILEKPKLITECEECKNVYLSKIEKLKIKNI